MVGIPEGRLGLMESARRDPRVLLSSVPQAIPATSVDLQRFNRPFLLA